MTVRSTIARFRHARQAFGVRTAVWALVTSALKRLAPCHVLRAMYIREARPEFTTPPPGLSGGFLDRETLERVAPDASYDMPLAFVDEALAKGDECYGITAGGRPVAYGWYARTLTRLHDHLRVHVPAGYLYMYKGFTLNAYRGGRLHAIGKTRALAAYRAQGYKGLVQCVDADNIGSLKSACRMGFVGFGWVFAGKLFGRWFTWTTPGCAAFGFRVEPLEGATPAPARDGAPRRQRLDEARPLV